MDIDRFGGKSSISRAYSPVPIAHEEVNRNQLPTLGYEHRQRTRRATSRSRSLLGHIMHLKHQNTLLFVIFLILLLIAVVTTGILGFKRDVKDANVHSSFTDDINVNVQTSTQLFNSDSTCPFIANAIVSLTDFDPNGVVSYSLIWGTSPNGNNTPADETYAESPWACFGIVDDRYTNFTFFSNKAPANGYMGARYKLNATSDGLLSHYPFDVYTAHLYFELAAELDPTLTCANATESTTSIPVPFQAFVGQSLQGFTATFELVKDPRLLAWNNFFILTLTIERDTAVKFFAVTMFIVTWLLTLAVAAAAGQVVLYHDLKPQFEIVGASTALLFALPQIRSSLPGIPLTPILSDTIGYYWMIALLGFSALALICHSIWQLRANRYKMRHPNEGRTQQFEQYEDEENSLRFEREKERLD